MLSEETKKAYNQLLHPGVLITLNIIIIFLALFSGNGRYFNDSALIHYIALAFVTLAVIRILSLNLLEDSNYSFFFSVSLPALSLLAISHILEFFGIIIFLDKPYIADNIVITLYIIWLISVIIAVIGSLAKNKQKKAKNRFVSHYLIPIIVGGIGYFLMRTYTDYQTLLRASWLIPVILAIETSVLAHLITFKKYFPKLSTFTDYFMIATVCISLATGSEFIETIFGMFHFNFHLNTITYIAHFLFFFALSFLIVGYGKIKEA